LKKNGYTLIELALVVFLVGLMLALAIPRVRETLLHDGLKATVRHLIGEVRELRSEAVREQVDYVLQLDLNNHAFWTYSADMTPEKRDEQKKAAYQFPAGVTIVDVSQIGMENKSEGEVAIKIFKQGYVQPTVIHLKQEDRNFTLYYAPFLSTIKVYEKYARVTPEGEEQE